MTKLNIHYAILVLFTLLIATQINVSAKIGDEGDEQLLDYICLKSEKLTRIHFYARDTAGGPNSTVHEVARAAISTDDLFSFGKVQVFDGVMTVGTDRNSKKLGKVQGILTSADMNTTAMAMSFNVVFTSGKYNGSTLSLAGRNQVLERERHISVIGGTGVFRFTRGYVVIKTYSTVLGKNSVFVAVFEYTVYTTFCPLM